MKHATKRTKAKTAGATRGRTARTGTVRARDPRLPAAGTVLRRTFKGKELRVTVLDEGFRHAGKEFRSLTALALAITGYRAISGPHFFGLTRAATEPSAPAQV